MVSQSDAIYWYQCRDLTCDDEYIGETSRTFGERYKEHLKDPSPIHHHNNQTNHPINQNNFKIIGREGHHMSRYIKESIFIRVNNPTLNNTIGKFNLMKSTAVDESLSSMNQQFCSRENQLLQMLQQNEKSTQICILYSFDLYNVII